MKIYISLILILILFLSNRIFGQEELIGYGKNLPSDQTQFNSSFSEFRANLISALNSKDANFIRQIILPRIQLDEHSEEQNNVDYFLRKYNIDDPKNVFWEIISKLISLGGHYMDYDSSYQFPSLFFNNEYERLLGEDWYGEILSSQSKENLGSSVSEHTYVYKNPSIDSKIEGYLNFEIVLITNFEYDVYQDWYSITLRNKKTGYVQSKDMWLAIADYYCIFKEINGSWYLTHFEITGI